MIDAVPIEVQQTKCFHCKSKIWELKRKVDEGNYYKCKVCGNELFYEG
jgi:DNA-directed RNA polymerase subunit RPC12/RpoP